MWEQDHEEPHTEGGRVSMLSRLCKDTLVAFQAGTRANNRELFNRAHELSNFFVRNAATPELIDTIIELERSIIDLTGPHKQFVEKCIFRAISTSALYCAPERGAKKRLTLDRRLFETAPSIQHKQRYSLALKLVSFSEEVFSLSKPRDTFNSKRKGLALELLDRVDAYYDVPACMPLFMAALASAKKTLVLAAVEFYESYLGRRNVPPTPEVIALLNDLVLKTRDRSVAVVALHLQVASGVISELGALSAIDDWKERNPDRW